MNTRLFWMNSTSLYNYNELRNKKSRYLWKKESIIYDFILELEKIITEVLLKDTEEEWKTEEVVFDQRIIDYLLPD